MNQQICINCQNIKPINSTDNRLVTESCGHVKCMDCLLKEKAGCAACLQESYEVEDDRNKLDIDDDNDEDIFRNESADDDVVRNESDHDIVRNESADNNHIVTLSDEKGKFYFCTKCQKRCHNKWQLTYHSYCNGKLKPYQCPISACDKSFVTKSHFKYHMRVHRNEKKYSCELCRYSFIAKSKLKRHMLKHSGERKHICPIAQCGKAFSNISALKQHIRIHSEERPYQCKKCDFRFRDRSNYYKHADKHTENNRVSMTNRVPKKIFQCPRCPSFFYSGKDMRRHSGIHIDSKPFRCKICQHKSFRRKDNLERHIRNSHPACATSSAIEVDELALAERANFAQNTTDVIKKSASDPDKEYLIKEKSKLEHLNPLPPLSQEIIEKHTGPVMPDEVKATYSYILEANNARESVIFVAKGHNFENCGRKTVDVKEFGYVHKIRKANSMLSHNDVKLPPIDESKLLELKQTNKLDVGSPPRNVDLYKKILYDKPERDSSDSTLKEDVESSPKHWRRKLKLNTAYWDN